MCDESRNPGAAAKGSDDDTYNPLDLEQLKLLYDYTKFHIGMYATLITGLLAFVSFGFGEARELYLWGGFSVTYLLYAVTLLFFLAGVAGAVVASNIVYDDWNPFFKKPGGNLRGTRRDPAVWKARVIKWTPGPTLSFVATLEHWLFWLGLLVAGASIAVVAWAAGPAQKLAITSAAETYAARLGTEGTGLASFSAGGADLPQPFGVKAKLTSVRIVEPGVAVVDGENTFTQAAPPAGAASRSLSGRFVAILGKDGGGWSVRAWSTSLK